MTRAYSRPEGTLELSTSYTAESDTILAEQDFYTKAPIEGAFVHSSPAEGTIYIPREVEGHAAVLYAPGFLEFQAATAPLARELAKRGLITITMKPMREQPEESRWSPKHLNDPLILQQQVIHSLMKTVRKQYGIEQFDLIGHSMGGEEVVGAAHHETVVLGGRDIKVRSVVGDQPLGFDGDNLRKKVLARAGAIMTGDLTSIPDMMQFREEDFLQDAWNHIFRHFGRSALEGFHCMKKPKAVQQIIDLRAAGVKVGATTGENDNFFRTWAVRRHTGHMLDGHWEIPDADHLHANTHPSEHADYLKWALLDLNGQEFDVA